MKGWRNGEAGNLDSTLTKPLPTARDFSPLIIPNLGSRQWKKIEHATVTRQPCSDNIDLGLINFIRIRRE